MNDKTIPYTVTNSFFYVEESDEPLPFLTTNIDSKINPNNTDINHSDFLRQFGKGLKSLNNN